MHEAFSIEDLCSVRDRPEVCGTSHRKTPCGQGHGKIDTTVRPDASDHMRQVRRGLRDDRRVQETQGLPTAGKSHAFSADPGGDARTRVQGRCCPAEPDKHVHKRSGGGHGDSVPVS